VLSVSAINSVMAYMISAICVTCLHLRNVGETAKLMVTITRFALPRAYVTPYSGYELPRLNERLIYLLFFSIFSSLAFCFSQRAAHRTLLPYRPVSVRECEV
jgi:hypothetical protein